MVRFKIFVAVLAGITASTAMPRDLMAQRLYSGSTSADSQYPGGGSIDSNGRAVNAEGRSVDRYGHVIDGTNQTWSRYAYPSHSASGLYYPGGYSGLSYSNGIGYSVGVGGYSGGYVANSGRFVTGTSSGPANVAPPRTIGTNGVYNSRAIMNNSTRGGSVEYTNNGNGYIYAPGSSSQTVISSGPSIFPTMTVVQPSQPPVLIQSQPMQKTAKTFAGNSSAQSASVIPSSRPGDIQLVNPKESPGTLTYVLNGTTYSIKPGFAQTFADDRVWTIEFLRGGSGSQPIRYDLRAGTYLVSADENGWDLRRFAAAPVPELLTSPTLPAPSAAARSTAPALVPAPTPSPDL